MPWIATDGKAAMNLTRYEVVGDADKFEVRVARPDSTSDHLFYLATDVDAREVTLDGTKWELQTMTKRLTREQVETIAHKVLGEYAFKHEVHYWLDTDATQRVEIATLNRQLEDTQSAVEYEMDMNAQRRMVVTLTAERDEERELRIVTSDCVAASTEKIVILTRQLAECLKEKQRIQQDFSNDLADREGDLYEQIKELIEHVHTLSADRDARQGELERLLHFLNHSTLVQEHHRGGHYIFQLPDPVM